MENKEKNDARDILRMVRNSRYEEYDHMAQDVLERMRGHEGDAEVRLMGVALANCKLSSIPMNNSRVCVGRVFSGEDWEDFQFRFEFRLGKFQYKNAILVRIKQRIDDGASVSEVAKEVVVIMRGMRFKDKVAFLGCIFRDLCPCR